MPNQAYPPGPTSWPPVRQLFALRRDPLAFLQGLARDHGDLVYLRIAGRPIYLVNHPDLVHEVLVTQGDHFSKGRGLQRAKRLLGEGLLTSEGSYHLAQRRRIQPLFHRRQIAAYAETMVQQSMACAASWRSGAVVDMHEEMMGLTLAIVGETLFGQDLTHQAGAVGEAMAVLTRNFRRLLSPFAPLTEWLPTAENRRLRQSVAQLDHIVNQMVSNKAAVASHDLVSLLLAATGDNNGDHTTVAAQLRDEVLTLLLAGHETTANALSFTWWLLSQHEDVAAQLHAEVDSVLNGRAPTLADLEQLPYTRMVFAEALRLYPPAWVIGRQACADVEIGGYTIPTGATVLASQWVMHHDARYYPAPDRFDPQRWQPAAIAARPKFAYFPFGAGSRICIGEHFAWMEGILVLATLTQRWQTSALDPAPLALQAGITLRPRNGLPMRLQERG